METKEYFLKELIALSNTQDVLSVSKQVSELNVKFKDFLIEEERLRQVSLIEKEEKGEKVDWSEIQSDPIQNKFKEILQVFLSKKKEILEKKKIEEEGNLKIKKSILSELRNLVQNEENIGKAFSIKKELNEKWNDIGNVSRLKEQELNAEYFKLNEEFNYNINIYKELKDNDYRKNEELKNEVINKLKKLKEEKHIKTIETTLKSLQNEWNEIGPVKKEIWEDFKEKYWFEVKYLYQTIGNHYDNQKLKRKENIEKKKVLMQKIIEATSITPNHHKDWDTQTKIIIALQEEWKNIGRGEKEEDDELWTQMRKHSNDFFDRKKSFYELRKDQFDSIKLKKDELIKEVESIRNSTNWKDTTHKIIEIQKKWKKLGSSGPKNDNKQWKIFRNHCDVFFQAKENFYQIEEKKYIENLNKKLELIKIIKDYKPSNENIKTSIEQLKVFSSKFNEIGNVPRDKKDEIYTSYKESINNHYSSLKLEKNEQKKVLYQAKIETLKASPNSEKLIDKEKSFLRNQISKFNKEITQLENNLGFFKYSKGINPLKEQAEKNIKLLRNKIDDLKKQLKMIPKNE